MLEILHGVEDQLDLQYHAHSSPSIVIIFKILANFGQKIAKNENCDFLPFHKNFNNFITAWARRLKFGQVMQNKDTKRF